MSVTTSPYKVRLTDDNVLIAGGVTGPKTASSKAYILNVRTGKTIALPAAPRASYAAACGLATPSSGENVVVVAGGAKTDKVMLFNIQKLEWTEGN